MTRPLTPTVLLHAFTTLDDGGQEHVDADFRPDLVNGWSVIVRRDFHDGADPEPFDLLDETERDFPADDLPAAEAYAAQLAAEWQAEIDRY